MPRTSLPNTPFVLLDDARTVEEASATLYSDPAEILTADDPLSLSALIDRIAIAADQGLHAAGYLSYEAGLAIEPVLMPLIDAHPRTGPLAWFGLFRRAERLDTATISALLQNAPSGSVGSVTPLLSRAAYGEAFATVQEYIRAGDIYQANLTFPCTVAITGDPIGLYAALRARSSAPHGGIVATETRTILSFSPELFVMVREGIATTQPMKGTAARDSDPARDAEAIARLRADEKQRAENMMIVDLLRNDLSRVSEPGSVHVPELFRVETYPTVHQMVSTICGRLEPGRGIADVLRALYPCGSITGAPKIRAQQIIAEVEATARNVYTGSIGAIEAGKSAPQARFNVAIRTLTIEKGADHGMIGLGSGVVADSDVNAEWAECLVKARYLSTLDDVGRDRGR